MTYTACDGDNACAALANRKVEDVFLAQGDNGGGEGGSFLFPLLMIAGLFAIFYFLLIRPQRRRREEQQKLQRAVSVGDEVVTIGGLYGTVVELDEKTIILETSEGVYSRYARAAIAEVTGSEHEDSDSDSEADLDDSDADSGSGSGSGTSSGDKVIEQRDITKD